MGEPKQVEARFFVGPPIPIDQLLRQAREEEEREQQVSDEEDD